MVKSIYLALISIILISTVVEANNDIGYKFYEKGNYKKALKVWIVESEKGNKEATYNIGLLYFFGNGVQKNLSIAFDYCRKAAFMGSSRAQNNLAFMYMKGLGVDKSYVDSYAWSLVAIKYGYNSQGMRDDVRIQLTPAMLRDAGKLFSDIIKDINNE